MYKKDSLIVSVRIREYFFEFFTLNILGTWVDAAYWVYTVYCVHSLQTNTQFYFVIILNTSRYVAVYK